jgi:hypothetical protein
MLDRIASPVSDFLQACSTLGRPVTSDRIDRDNHRIQEREEVMYHEHVRLLIKATKLQVMLPVRWKL